MIQVNFKVNEERDPVLATWIRELKGKGQREMSITIRQVLRAYLSNQTGPMIPPEIVTVEPQIQVVTGEIQIEDKGLSPDEMAAKLDNMF